MSRVAGWYWVRKLDWDNLYGDWVPALWQVDSRSWRSAMFSGIPDSEFIIGSRVEPPVNTADQQEKQFIL